MSCSRMGRHAPGFEDCRVPGYLGALGLLKALVRVLRRLENLQTGL